ncbi:hypothetical protein BDR05DRAFT_987799 [Suillus weaverae]|nr:hypothetical protein BDR05DRAFT_987799 [Suillus weaverae]
MPVAPRREPPDEKEQRRNCKNFNEKGHKGRSNSIITRLSGATSTLISIPVTSAQHIYLFSRVRSSPYSYQILRGRGCQRLVTICDVVFLDVIRESVHTSATLETPSWFKRDLSPLNLCSFHSIHRDAIEGFRDVKCAGCTQERKGILLWRIEKLRWQQSRNFWTICPRDKGSKILGVIKRDR